jgi:hypothetical protein
MKRDLSIFLRGLVYAALILGGWTATPAAPQTVTASMNGTVVDQTGAVVPEVQIKVRNINTGLERTGAANEDGYYTIPLLPVGEYELTAEHAGFATLKRSRLKLTVGQMLTLDLTLAVAGAQEVVEVAAQAPLVEVTQASVNSTVNDQAVATLPVNGRNFIDFVLLTPGVVKDHRGGDLAFGGLRGTNSSLQIDGADNNNTFFGQTLGRAGAGRTPYQFSLDAVAEFQVNTSAYSAEFGHAGGAVVNVVTKSGTNQFHGSAFEYYRDRSLNANEPFNKANQARQGLPNQQPPFHAQQFGGTMGGPIIKDKAFFFFNYDGQRRALPNVVILNLPANFHPNPTEQQALNVLRSMAQNYTLGFDQDVYMFKGDWQLSSAHRLSGRYNRQNFTGTNLENPGQTNALNHTGTSLVITDTLALSLTSALSSHLVNDLRYQFARDDEPGTANSDLPEAEIRQAGQTVLFIGRNFFSPRETAIRRHQVTDSLSYIAGNHTWKAGADILVDRIKNFFPASFSGEYLFTSLAQFASGRPIGYVQAFAGPNTSGPLTFPNNHEFASFVQDDWRVTPHLTLNVGLRYDLQDIANPRVSNPDPGLASLGLRTDRINLDKNNVGPRFGFALSPLAGNRLVIRGGYGFFYARTPSIMVAQAHSTNGINVQQFTFVGSAAPTFPQLFTTLPPGAAQFSPPNIFVFAPDYVNPYIQQGNFGIEYELAPNLAISIGYLGVKGTHLQRTRNVNLRPAVPMSIELVGVGTRTVMRSPGRLLSNFTRISQFESTANSIYHGLLVQADKRFSHDFQFLISYTYSKAIDDTPDATSVVAFSTNDDAKQVQDPLNLRDDRGISYTDFTHRFVASGLWELNYAHHLANPGARAILSGWSLSGILTAQSAPAYSAFVGADLNNDSNRATDRVPGVGRNTFRGFNFVSFDPRITREISFAERTKLQLIFEAFNVVNRVNFRTISVSGANPSLNAIQFSLNAGKLVPRSDFGTPREAFDPRMIQLAAKFIF